MKKNLSLQWRLTLLTTFLVIVACLVLSAFVSTSAVLYMDSIGNSLVDILPNEAVTGDFEMVDDFVVDVPSDILKQIQETKVDFWKNSIFITIFIALLSSTLTYFIVGFALKPLKQLGNQLEEIQVKNINQPVLVNSGAHEIVILVLSFNKMLKRLEKSFTIQKQFSANAAHELRTPLAIMKAKLEVIHKQKSPTTEDYAEVIEKIDNQVDRFSDVINTLLEMMQTQTATKKDCIELSEIIEEVICDLTQLAIQNQIELIHIPSYETIIGNDVLICRAIYNLVENAIKYNKPNGKVIVELKQEGSFAKVIISDTGIGISDSDCEHIFEPFFRVDKSRSRSGGGTGLGLALVQEIAQRHGGNVRVLESSPEGTQIELSLYCKER